MFSKKSIGPLIAISLLIVVSVVAVIGFQTWYNTYSSEIFSDNEQQSNILDNNIKPYLLGNTLNILNPNGNNLTILQILVDGKKTNISANISSEGLKVDLSEFLASNNEVEKISIITNNGIVTKEFYYYKSISQSNNFLCNITTPEGFAGGDGSLANPWEICNCDMLQNISNYLGGNYSQICDIDCGIYPYNVGEGFNPIGDSWSNCFRGNYNGNNFKINNLYINRSIENYVGLFGYVYYGNINNSYSSGSVVGNNSVGGLVGSLEDSNIYNSYFCGSVVGNNNVGGLVGDKYYGDIDNSYFSGSVVGDWGVGGLVGVHYGSNIDNSYSTGLVFGNDYVGGLVGENYFGNIDNSYSSSSVVGNETVGGLVGVHYGSNIDNSYSTGSVVGNFTFGGFVGNFTSGNILNSYYDNETSNQSNAFGSGSTTGIVGKTTIELQTPTSNTGIYANWSLSNWNFGTSNDYPKLAWE